MSKIFLSHTSADKPFVRKLATDLRRFGHTVWIDEAEINIGDSLIGKIRDGLDTVDYVAVVLSEASIGSKWVQKEIEIASNREIEEKRVVVLPIVIQQVELPGFLKGKFYGDFSDEAEYEDKLNLLLRSLGDSNKIIKEASEELIQLKAQLDEAKSIAQKHKKQYEKVQEYSLLNKNEKLKAAILKENERTPQYAPINNVYAFSIGGSNIPITLGYLLFIIQKIKMRGGHVIEYLLEEEDKWDIALKMLEAYSDMINNESSE